MSQPSMSETSTSEASQTSPNPSEAPSETATTTRPPSFVKLAMRNMVRKRGTSLYHFALTTLGLLSVLVGLAYLTR